MSFASIVEPFRGANRLTNKEYYRWRLFGPEGGMVESNSGISVQTDAIDSLHHGEFDMAILCAGSHIEHRRYRNVEAMARERIMDGRPGKWGRRGRLHTAAGGSRGYQQPRAK